MLWLQIIGTILVLCVGVLLIAYVYEENDDYYLLTIVNAIFAMVVILFSIWWK